MGNSDSKPSKGSSAVPLTSAQSYQSRVHALLESEFIKRSESPQTHISFEGFQACLKSVQDEFDLYSISNSPLGIGLFELYADEKPDSKGLMSMSEYAMAMAVLFNNNDPSTIFKITSQAMLKWYALKNNLATAPRELSSEAVIEFFEASWTFAWAELLKRLLSNACLNGKAETEAIQRFSETHVKFFASTPNSLFAKGIDRTIVVSVGDEVVQVPTSFSYLSRPRNPGSDTPPFRNKAKNAYPEL